METTLAIEGMTCAACVRRIEKALASAPGVAGAVANLATERAAVRYDPAQTSPEVLAQVVERAGYAAHVERATPSDAEANARGHEREALGRRLSAAAVLTLPLWLLEMGPMLVPAFGHWLHAYVSMQALWVVSLVLASAVQFGPGWRFYRTGWAALRHGGPDMNTLVMLGTTAAYGYSVVATFAPGVLPEGTVHVYYEAAATIITLILAGKYLEAVAKGRTS
ncbi:MAG TPA: cation transporter, partial [Rubricoccaceae bacterium]|nr:cation transporter [Rubricoccaceae bacterium]